MLCLGRTDAGPTICLALSVAPLYVCQALNSKV